MITKEELAQKAKIILTEVDSNWYGNLTSAKEFFRTWFHPDNSYLKSLNDLRGINEDNTKKYLKSILSSFIRDIENGLFRQISTEREAQIVTVLDYLSQAQMLLEENDIHPVAPAFIIGASLEEFLREWFEEEINDLGDKKPCISSYANALRGKDLISKQDVKDITSWSGIRNDAAHGHWDRITDKSKIKIMLEGVNLFINKYSGSSY